MPFLNILRYAQHYTRTCILWAGLAVGLLGCSDNPIQTVFQKEISPFEESREIALGEQLYTISLQASGGSDHAEAELGIYVTSIGRQLAKYSKRPQLPYEFRVLNSSTPISWALPGGKIAISRGLLAKLENEAELAAILASEITHVAAGHAAPRPISVATEKFDFWVRGKAETERTSQQKLNSNRPHYRLSDEIQADRLAMQMLVSAGYNPASVVHLIQKWQSGADPGAYHALLENDPHSAKRLTSAQKALEKLLPMGARNPAAFRKATVDIRQSQPDYDVAESAVSAMTQNEFHKALALIDRALGNESRESKFHEIKAVALIKLNRARDALRALDQSIKLDQTYYRPLLRRGMLRYELKAINLAKADLEASLKLTPSQQAYETLGSIAEKDGLCEQAIEYYHKAIEAEGSPDKRLNNRIAALKLTCA